MNTAEKLRFLADRAEDGKEFMFKGMNVPIRFKNKQLTHNGVVSDFRLNTFLEYDFVLSPQWSFTEDEKVILRNLPQEYKWIARDENGDICVYSKKPIKTRASGAWDCSIDYEVKYLEAFNHLFQSIQWEDEEPCEFRRYL